MPALIGETLRQVARGEISDNLPFIRLEIVIFDASNSKKGRKDKGRVEGQLVYADRNDKIHSGLVVDVTDDIMNRNLKLPDKARLRIADAGLITRHSLDTVLFIGGATHPKIEENPVARAITVNFVDKNIAFKYTQIRAKSN